MANYNTQTTGSAGMAPELRTFYDRQLIENAKPVLVHNQFGQKRPIPAGEGQTINFRKFSPLPKATTPLTEGVTPDGRSVTITQKTATVKQYGDYITVSDYLELTAPDKVVTENNKLLGVQAGETLDAITAAVLNAGTNVQPVGDASGRSDLTKDHVLTVKEIKKAVATLKKMKARPIDGSFVAIVHPTVAYDLMSDPEWVNVKNYDPKDMYEGEIGKLYGVRFVETTEAKVFTGAGAGGVNVYSTLVLGADAYGVTEVTGGGLRMIAKSKGSAGTADPLDQRSTQGWKATHVAEILTEEFMVRIESGASLDEATA